MPFPCPLIFTGFAHFSPYFFDLWQNNGENTFWDATSAMKSFGAKPLNLWGLTGLTWPSAGKRR
jgi:hypothetical protein